MCVFWGWIQCSLAMLLGPLSWEAGQTGFTATSCSFWITHPWITDSIEIKSLTFLNPICQEIPYSIHSVKKTGFIFIVVIFLCYPVLSINKCVHLIKLVNQNVWKNTLILLVVKIWKLLINWLFVFEQLFSVTTVLYLSFEAFYYTLFEI